MVQTGTARVRTASAVVGYPRELVVAVSIDKRAEAAILLGGSDVIRLSDAQARELGAPLHPDKILEDLLKDRERGLAQLESRPSQLKDEGAQMVVRDLKQQIIDYRAWPHRLRPYLIKAVSLNPQGLGFHGRMAGKTLYVDQITPISDRPVPMINMAVIAFLPVKPDKIYTSFSVVD